MPKAYIIIFYLTFCLLSVYAQSKEVSIANIRREYQNINSNKSLRQVRLENEQIPEPATDGGWELVGYFEGDRVFKIKVWVGLSNRILQREYYLNDDGLFFVYLREDGFAVAKSGLALDRSKFSPASEYRFYLNADKIIAQNIKGKPIYEAEPLPTVKDFRADVEAYTKILRSHLKRTNRN